MTPSKVWFGPNGHTKFWYFSKFWNFYDVILSWRHYVTYITYFFDDLSLIFYFSLGFLNSTFKSFEKYRIMVFTESVQSPPNLSISQIFTKFRVFHLKSWFWQKSGHFWSGTFWPVICLIPRTSVINLWSFLTRVFLNFVFYYGQLGVQSCIEISKKW